MTVHEALEIALQHHQAGRLGEAEGIYRRIIEECPEVADAAHFLGVLAHQTGRHEEAANLIRRAIALAPEVPSFQANLGAALAATGAHSAAIAAYREAIRLAPDLAEAHYNLGNSLFALGDLEAALAAFAAALARRPGYAEALYNAGNVHAALDQIDDAIAAYSGAVRARPDYAEAHYNLGNMLAKHDRSEEAAACYRTAIQCRPDFPDAHFNLGNALKLLGRLDAAAAAFREALRCDAKHTSALTNLGNVLKDQGQIGAAIACYREAVALEPEDAALRSILVLYLRYDPQSDDRIIATAEADWDARHAQPMRTMILPHHNPRTPDRRLRVGYVSPDFWDHSVGRNVLPLFTHHDRGRFEVICYSGVTRADAMTVRFQSLADRWRDTTAMSDEELSACIRSDEVDILVDLAQHTAGNRLTTFARQPAPVQISFAGYPGGSGIAAIQHHISDARLEAPGGRSGPQTARLIDSFWCYDPCGENLAVNPLPALTASHVTFGCLNNFCKLNDPVLELWARVLGTVKGSRLLLLCPAGSHRDRVSSMLGAAVDFVEPCRRGDFLRLHHRVDLMLDTFPYTGHTTSLEALWMGVPVVSLCGATPVSRAGLSQLTHLGLEALVAHSPEDFVRSAGEWATDWPRLAALRQSLRARMEKSVLMDAAHFARSIEAIYRTAWQDWCDQAER